MEDKLRSRVQVVVVEDDPPLMHIAHAAAPATVSDAAVDAALPEQDRGAGFVGILREILETIIFALLVFLVVQAISRNYMVQSISMQPTLYEGQYLVVNRLVYANGSAIDLLKKVADRVTPVRRLIDTVIHAPRRGDVIVLVPITKTKPDLIKRVIGIGGDKVELRQGVLYLNDRAIDEPYVRAAVGQSWGPAVVGTGQLFVMGDNRGNSSDSRAFGMLPLSHVVGQAWLRYWPPKDWGFIRHYDLQMQAP